MSPAEPLVAVRRGTAAELHALDPFEHPVTGVRWMIGEVTAPAIVLGSRQDRSILDQDACERAGLEIVRRRSGGGVVVLRPDEIVWIDALIPAGIAHGVPDDVRGSMIWAGERWRAALMPLLGRGIVVHRGGMVDTAWSDLVCFAGVGPGELLLGGRKLVGLSQRRTRHGIRIQGLVHLDGASVDEAATLFVGPVPTETLPSAATLPVGASATSIAEAIAHTNLD